MPRNVAPRKPEITPASTFRCFIGHQKETLQENARTTLKDATSALDDQSVLSCDGFSSFVDFVAGGLSKKTNLAKQLRAIRKSIRPSKGTGSSSSRDPGSSS